MNIPLDDNLAAGAVHEAVPEPPKPTCTDVFRIARAEPWAVNTGNWCLFSSEPKLCFQINQGSPWSEGSMFPIYNIWSPAYFGITLSQSDSKFYKLSCNDLIVTRYEDDTASLKARYTGSVPFETQNVVGGIDVDDPWFFCCKCCFRYRGWVNLSNGERWRFDENNGFGESYYQFQRVHERTHAREFPKVFHKTLLWEFRSDWQSGFGEAPTDLPFTMDRDTRLCRAALGQSQRYWNPSKLVAPVIAIMNGESLVFLDTLKRVNEIETANLRELVLMTGLAIAKFERRELEK
ncbi:uncharacterized protein N7498_002840 [Penicillium cinerascens]|uniref:Uncharacterized protein n=1 Tax=Penicillium cinerascens TaxID=70096 RepID=A0A9W9NAV2_9EURO|nr:uncharacterized protein N7498_002840 [Penicillium cinerascens]KAJ5216433.1 hypothetical protein N7498_002840 [Penicillium cinerascens]